MKTSHEGVRCCGNGISKEGPFKNQIFTGDSFSFVHQGMFALNLTGRKPVVDENIWWLQITSFLFGASLEVFTVSTPIYNSRNWSQQSVHQCFSIQCNAQMDAVILACILSTEGCRHFKEQMYRTRCQFQMF